LVANKAQALTKGIFHGGRRRGAGFCTRVQKVAILDRKFTRKSATKTYQNR